MELDLRQVSDLLTAEIDLGLQSGVQLSVSYRGATAELALGENGLGVPMSSDMRVPWTCTSKPLGSIAFAIAWDAGILSLDTLVSSVLTDFTGNGKESIRIRDLLTHTAGIEEPMMSVDPSQADFSSMDSIEQFIWEVVRHVTTQSKPGTRMVYNPITNWFVLDRLLNTIADESWGASYRNLFEKLDLRNTDLGVDWALPEESRVTPIASDAEKHGLETTHLASILPLPGVGVWGPMTDLRKVGDVFLNLGNYNGDVIVRPQTATALTTTHWEGEPSKAIDSSNFSYGLGIMTSRPILGLQCSARAFGHAGGNTSSLIVDPEHDLVLAVYWNGRIDNVQTISRRHALVRALCVDLGICSHGTAPQTA